MPIPILFVDDEINILRTLRRMFFDSDEYEVHTAESGPEALAMLEEGLRPAVIVSDQRMPGMSGSELLAEVRQRYPEIVRIILTGYADIDAAIEAINVGAVFRYIAKPWEGDELKRAIDDAVRHWRLVQENRALTEELQRTNRKLADLNESLERKVAERTAELRRAYEANLRLTTELEAKIRELEGWDTLHQHILTIHPEEETLRVLAGVVCKVVCCEGVGIFLLEGEELVPGLVQYEGELACLRDDGELAALRNRVVTEQSSLLLIEDALPAAAATVAESMAIVPLGRERRVLGVVEVVTIHRSLTEEEVGKLHALASQGAIAILDARMDELLPELESSLDTILQEFDNEP